MFDDEYGYDYDDPKHPTYAERYANAADMARKAERERPGLFDLRRELGRAPTAEEWKDARR